MSGNILVVQFLEKWSSRQAEGAQKLYIIKSGGAESRSSFVLFCFLSEQNSLQKAEVIDQNGLAESLYSISAS